MGKIPKALFRWEVMEMFCAWYRQPVTWVDPSKTNHRADTKVREERLTRMQCQPSHGR
jgi:hypothetical protein